jgi:hypothetical protein
VNVIQLKGAMRFAYGAEILLVLPCNEEGRRQHLNSGHSMENSCTLDLYTAMFLAGHRHQVK